MYLFNSIIYFIGLAFTYFKEYILYFKKAIFSRKGPLAVLWKTLKDIKGLPRKVIQRFTRRPQTFQYIYDESYYFTEKVINLVLDLDQTLIFSSSWEIIGAIVQNFTIKVRNIYFRWKMDLWDTFISDLVYTIFFKKLANTAKLMSSQLQPSIMQIK